MGTDVRAGGQASILAYLRASSTVPQQQDAAVEAETPQTGPAPTERPSKRARRPGQPAPVVQQNPTLCALTLRDLGLRHRFLCQATLQQHHWARFRQVTSYYTAEDAAGHGGWGDADAISSIAICSQGLAAIAQKKGVLNLCQVELLTADSHTSHHRRSMVETEGSTWQQHMRTTSSRACAHIDSLPPGVTRLDLRQRMEDLAWNPIKNGQLAAVGSQIQPVQLLDLQEGRRKSVALTVSMGSDEGVRRLSSVLFTPQGPYTLAAMSRGGEGVVLWDTRRSRASQATLRSPANEKLQGTVQASPDGHLVYAVVEGNQLLVWDLRSGSSSAGVLNFGAMGLYSHPVLMRLNFAGAMATAGAQTVLPALNPSRQQEARPQALSTCWETAITSRGLDARSASAAPGCCAVDQLLMDPTDSTRLAVVMQDCSVGLLQMPSGAITHFCPPPTALHGLPTSACSSQGAYRHRRGCWAASNGNSSVLLAPSMWLQHPDPTSTSNPSAPHSTTLQNQPLSALPAVAAIDCRPGCLTPSPWPATGSSTSRSSWSAHALDTKAIVTPAMAAFRRQQTAVLARLQECQEERVEPDAELQAAWQASCTDAAHRWEEKNRPQGLAAVSDWVSCMASSTSSTCMLAGTFSGQLLVLT